MCTLKKVLGFIIVVGVATLFFTNNQCLADYKLTPEGEKLYKQWTEVLGYSAIDYVRENDPAPEIKPGLEITPQNAKDYPGLKKILPESIYRRLDPNHFLPIEQITITGTRPRYYPQPAIDGTRQNLKNCHINHETLQMEGYGYGLPFPHVTDPLHVVWNHVIARTSFEDSTWFDPITTTTYNKSRESDSVWVAGLGNYMVKSRMFSDIYGPNRESAYFKGQDILVICSLLLNFPPDVNGTAFLRTRFWDLDKQDYFVSYLPGLKRIRVLSGSDAQDPIMGSEMTWDTFGLDYQKMPSKTIFPNQYTILEEKIILQPVYPSRPSVKIEGEQFITLWEKRPVWVLEIKSLDRTYCFSKRIMYACMEHFKALYEEYYDRRGNLLRSWQDFKYMIPNGVATWEACDILNYISKRHSVVKMNVSANASKVKADQFDMRWLIKMAR